MAITRRMAQAMREIRDGGHIVPKKLGSADLLRIKQRGLATWLGDRWALTAEGHQALAWIEARAARSPASGKGDAR